MFKNRLAIQQINVADITGSVFQMRIELDYDMAEMIESIQSNGILNPLMLRKEGAHYHLIAGHRRLKAAKQVGLDTVPAVVYEKISLKDAALKGMVDNLNRRELTPFEQAIGYQKLLQEFDFSQRELARSLGKSQSIISEYVRTIEVLPVQVIDAVTNGIITFAHARVLLRLDSEQEILEFLQRIIAENIRVDELKQMITRYKLDTDTLSKRQLELQELNRLLEETCQVDKTLKNFWNTEIILKKSRIGDRLQVDFRSSADLSSKLEKLLVIVQTNARYQQK